MSYSKPIAILLATVVCATVSAADADAQSRGRSGGARSGGGRSGSGRGPTVGQAVPRSGGSRTQGPRGDRGRSYGDRGRSYGSRVIVSPRVVVRAPLRSYYYPYYGYRSGLSLGLYGGYGYPYGYAYPYGAYGNSHGYYPTGYGYGGYGYGGYGYAGQAYRDDVYGGIRIQGAPRDAQVFADGYYAGVVNDFDGTFQRLTLEAGPHEVEIRAPGFPTMTYDVNVQPGQTLNLHVR